MVMLTVLVNPLAVAVTVAIPGVCPPVRVTTALPEASVTAEVGMLPRFVEK